MFSVVLLSVCLFCFIFQRSFHLLYVTATLATPSMHMLRYGATSEASLFSFVFKDLISFPYWFISKNLIICRFIILVHLNLYFYILLDFGERSCKSAFVLLFLHTSNSPFFIILSLVIKWWQRLIRQAIIFIMEIKCPVVSEPI